MCKFKTMLREKMIKWGEEKRKADSGYFWDVVLIHIIYLWKFKSDVRNINFYFYKKTDLIVNNFGLYFCSHRTFKAEILP